MQQYGVSSKYIPTLPPSVSAGDPLHFRPQPSKLISKLKDNEGDNEGAVSSDSDLDEGEDDTGKQRPQVYVPPRVVAMPYDDDKVEGRRSKHKRSHGSVLQELKDELSDAPLELKVRVEQGYLYHNMFVYKLVCVLFSDL